MSRNYRFTISSTDSIHKAKHYIQIKSPDLLHQMNSVLRLQPGHAEEISLIDGSGEVFYAEIESISKTSAELKILQAKKSERELDTEITFFVPIIKAENFSWMLRKLTELGVQHFIPVICERSQKANIQALSSTKARERLQKIIEEATEQCEGAIFAQLHEAIELTKIKDYLPKDSLKIFANERLADSLTASSSAIYKPGLALALLVGPEGGLTDHEVKMLEDLEFIPYGLGKRLLKAETAAISLASKLT